MTYGIPTFMEFNSVREHLEFCKENGFGLFELALYYPWNQSDKLDLKDLARQKENCKIDFSIHIGDIDPFSFSPEIRRAAYENIAFVFGIAQASEARILNMHLVPGTYSSIRGKKVYAYDCFSEQYFDNVKRFIDYVSPLLEKTKCAFCIENTNGFKSFQKKAIEMLLENENFGLTFDIGHSYKAGGDDEKFILSHMNSLKHFHIHDVTQTANHISLGQGVLDIPRYLDMAERINACALIEVKSPSCLVESAEYLKDKGYMQYGT